MENTEKCLKCVAWDIAAKQNGCSHGMCEECFNKLFVRVNLPKDLEPDNGKSFMTPIQKRELAKKIHKEIQLKIDEWNDISFIKVHWNGDISVDGEYFEKWRLEEEKQE